MSIVIAALLPFITLVWYNAESLLINLGQDPQVAAKAGMYLRIVSFGLPGFAGFEICRRYLQAQGLMHAPTIVLFVASPFNVVANYLLVWGPDKIRLGFIGAPIASAASMWLMVRTLSYPLIVDSSKRKIDEALDGIMFRAR